MTGARSTHTAPFFLPSITVIHRTLTVAVQTAGRPFAQRADFVDTLDGAQAAHFSRELVLAGDDGWLP